MTKTVIVEADIDRVLDNPYRDFTNYPIDETQIARLMASLREFGDGEAADESGLWHAMPARPAKEAGTYEICFGHHRKVAAKRLGRQKIRLEVGAHDDDEMIKMLATENGTQRVNNSAASLDSVAAITRRLAYLLLRTDSLDECAIIIGHSPTALEGRGVFARSRDHLLNKDGVGAELIYNYAPKGSLELAEIRSSLSTLKADGGYQRIIEQVTDQVRKERATEEAEFERIVEQQREAEAKRLRLEREVAESLMREAALVEAREHARQQEAARRAEAAEFARQLAEEQHNAKREAEERRKKEVADRQEQEAAANLARLQVEKEQRDREEAQRTLNRAEYEKVQEMAREERRKAAERKEAELLALAAKAALADPLLDSRVVPLFRNHHCLSRFREMVTNVNDRHWFPLDGQLGHAKAVCAAYEKANPGKSASENLTANFVGSYLRAFLEQNQRAAREDERRARTLSQSFGAELTNAVKGSTWIYSAVGKMVELLDKGATPPHDFEEKLRSLEMQATDQIARLRAKSGYVRDAKEIAGNATPMDRRPAISRR